MEQNKNICEVVLSDNNRYYLVKGSVLETIRDCEDQCELHYFRTYKIPKNTIMIFIEKFTNLYGTYIRCNFNGKIVDILPQDLKFIKS